MRFSALLTATISLAATVVQCRLSDLGIPSTIKPGDIFSAVGHTQISQPRQYTMVWAITAQEDAILGAIGPYLMNVVDLPSVLGGAYNATIPNLSVPTTFTATGPAVVQAAIMEFYGVYNQPTLETWAWNVTIGDATSEDLVVTTVGASTSRGCST